MRQLQGFLEAIRVRLTKKEYYRAAVLTKLHGGEILPLEEILGPVGSEEPASAFDPDTEKFMDAYAQRRLKENQAHVGR